MRMADACNTVRELFQKAPFFSHTVMEIVKQQLEAGTLQRACNPPKTHCLTAADTCIDPVFGIFRQALKKMMLSKSAAEAAGSAGHLLPWFLR
jgi:hypothetical protein